MFDERGKLVTQMVRTQALLWSVENPVHKHRLRELIKEIEKRIALLDREQEGLPSQHPLPSKPADLRR